MSTRRADAHVLPVPPDSQCATGGLPGGMATRCCVAVFLMWFSWSRKRDHATRRTCAGATGGLSASALFRGLVRHAGRQAASATRPRLAVAGTATGAGADTPTATAVGVPPAAKRAGAMLSLATACAGLLLSAFVAPAFGWSRTGHALITEEAVARLPEPLRARFAEDTLLEALKRASVAPDGWAEKESDHDRPDERPRHFLNIDALTDQPYPFKGFPRDRAKAVEQFGAEALAKHGSVPWAAADALARLTDALTAGRTVHVVREAGMLAHYASDLHMPLHTTANYDGRQTGNHGVHKAVEVGLVARFEDVYRRELRRGRRQERFLADPQGRLFDWLVAAHASVKPILEADSVARHRARYNPAQHFEDLDDVTSKRARPYYEALRQELKRRGSPEAAAMRDAAAHLADLLYTAWVRAGKPPEHAPPPQPQDEPMPMMEVLVLGAAAALLFSLLWPRRRPPKPDGAGPNEPPRR